ncbi:MAG: DNA cytosine methyltransferase [Candidatus Dormibacteraceae bacterium]
MKRRLSSLPNIALPPEMPRELNEPRVLSLFTGCGGMDLGFEVTGFHSTAMVEIEKFACATLRFNFPNARVIGPPEANGDIRQLCAEDVVDVPVDLLIGGPPCQSFSIAAGQRFLRGDAKFKRIGFMDRARGTLVHDYLRLLAEIRPKVFVIENVPGLMELDGASNLSAILDVCRDLGYSVAEPRILQAADYGVPQYRRRLMILGALGAAPEYPVPTHSPRPSLFEKPYVTVAEALIGLDPSTPSHLPRNHFATSIQRYRTLCVGQREQLGRVDRLDPCRPSKTVIAGGSNGGGRSHLHPLLARTMTVRECARLQTFPDGFEFSGTMSRQFTQVGNAVPPLLAEVLARQIGEQFFGMRFVDPPRLGGRPPAQSVRECVMRMYGQVQGESELLYEDTPHPYLDELLRVPTAV